LTGKTYRAHDFGDEGSRQDPVIYYFRLSSPSCERPCPRSHPARRRQHRSGRAARHCPNTCGAWNTSTSPRTPPAPHPGALSR
jgi:hypothetical protein